MIYWDTSCALKLYTPEADSSVYLGLASQAKDPLYCSDLTKTELYYALRRKESVGDISPHASDALYQKFVQDAQKGRFIFIPMGADVVDKAREVAKICYARPSPILLRTLDGLHLATALVAKLEKIAVTDQRMRMAARVLELSIVP